MCAGEARRCPHQGLESTPAHWHTVMCGVVLLVGGGSVAQDPGTRTNVTATIFIAVATGRNVETALIMAEQEFIKKTMT